MSLLRNMEADISDTASKMAYVSCERVHAIHSVQHTAVTSVKPFHSTLLTQLSRLLPAKPSAASSTAPAAF